MTRGRDSAVGEHVETTADRRSGRATVRLVLADVPAAPGAAAATAGEIRLLRPDVAFLSGAPVGPRARSRGARLARLSGLFVMAGGHYAGGCLLLGGLPVRPRETRDLVLGPALPRTLTPLAGLAVGRWRGGLSLAVVEADGAVLAVALAELTTLEAARRAAEAAQVRAILGTLDVDHVVLAARLHEGPDGPARAALSLTLREIADVGAAGWALFTGGDVQVSQPDRGPADATGPLVAEVSVPRRGGASA